MAENAMNKALPENMRADKSANIWSGRTIALVGFMGSGKSTAGRQLAEMLARPFRDSDREIEKSTGLSITDIFARYGEHEFRRIERRTLARLLQKPVHVLATGGGIYLDQKNRDMLKKKTVTVWLDVDLETAWQRVSGCRHRPLLQMPDPKTALADLYRARQPVYALADIRVPGVRQSHAALALRILESLKDWNGKNHN